MTGLLVFSNRPRGIVTGPTMPNTKKHTQWASQVFWSHTSLLINCQNRIWLPAVRTEKRWWLELSAAGFSACWRLWGEKIYLYLRLHHQTSAYRWGKASSKSKWRTIGKRGREKETCRSQGFVSRAPVYLFLLLGCECITHVGFFLSCVRAFFPLSQAAAAAAGRRKIRRRRRN